MLEKNGVAAAAGRASVTISVGYILHRFPMQTDTFIRREVTALRREGVTVEVVSVWHPRPEQTTPDLLWEWESSTHFMLPASFLGILLVATKQLFRSPRRFLSTFCLAMKLRRPGLKGLVYQLAYFIEALLAADTAISRGYNHLHNHIGDQSGTVTMLAARYANIPFSITYHGWPVFYDAFGSRIREKVRACSFVRCISYFCRSQLLIFSQVPDTSNLEVIHCGINVKNYHYRAPRDKAEVIFCAARLSTEKGLWLLIEAFATLRKAGHDLRLRLAGNGPELAMLTEQSKQLGVSDDVFFLGNLDEAGIQLELQNADLFVLPSMVEGIPVSVMEAMAVGVPVVATNVGGTGELVYNEITGLLVRASDSEALVSSILRLVGDPSLRRKLSRAARELVEEEFDLHTEAKKLARLLEDHSSSRNRQFPTARSGQ